MVKFVCYGYEESLENVMLHKGSAGQQSLRGPGLDYVIMSLSVEGKVTLLNAPYSARLCKQSYL